MSPAGPADGRPSFAPAWAPAVAWGAGEAVTTRAADPASLQQLSGRSMGTTWSLRFDNPAMLPFDRVRDAVQAALDRVVSQMSHWDEGSILSRFRRARSGESLRLPVEFAQVLTAALHWAAASDGAFDPTIGPITAAWGFGPDAPAPGGPWCPPTPSVLEAAARRTGWRRIEFDPRTRELRQPGELSLDFSGIAKGFAVDHACGALAELGLRDFVLEVGGEVRALGRRPSGAAWTLRIALPADLQASLRLPPLTLQDLAVASSGDGWHWHEHEGRRWSHTIDPRSAAPVAAGTALVTVLRRTCMEADALATTLTVLGPEAGLAFADAHGVAALFVERRPDGPVLRRSAAWPDAARRGPTAAPAILMTPATQTTQVDPTISPFPTTPTTPSTPTTPTNPLTPTTSSTPAKPATPTGPTSPADPPGAA